MSNDKGEAAAARMRPLGMQTSERPLQRRTVKLRSAAAFCRVPLERFVRTFL
jgi:hypothetical protein